MSWVRTCTGCFSFLTPPHKKKISPKTKFFHKIQKTLLKLSHRHHHHHHHRYSRLTFFTMRLQLPDFAPVDFGQRMRFTFKKITKSTWYGTEANHRMFRSAFGCSPAVAEELWVLGAFPVDYDPFYVFVGLYFLKVYPTLDILVMVAQISRKTIIKHVWYVVEVISMISGRVVSLSGGWLLCCVVFEFYCVFSPTIFLDPLGQSLPRSRQDAYLFGHGGRDGLYYPTTVSFCEGMVLP